MSAYTTIKKDCHGLYVLAGGYVFRPEPTRHANPHPLAVGMGYPPYFRRHSTEFLEGDRVRARHVSQSVFGRVRGDHHEEFWHSHGTYLGQAIEDLWEPLA